MTVPSTPAPSAVRVRAGRGRKAATVFASAGVDAQVEMALHMRAPDDDFVSILFGNERFSLEFYDVESLRRLRDLAEDGARRLQAALEIIEREEAGDAGPVDADGGTP